jgi:hypothetical protein
MRRAKIRVKGKRKSSGINETFFDVKTNKEEG